MWPTPEQIQKWFDRLLILFTFLLVLYVEEIFLNACSRFVQVFFSHVIPELLDNSLCYHFIFCARFLTKIIIPYFKYKIINSAYPIIKLIYELIKLTYELVKLSIIFIITISIKVIYCFFDNLTKIMNKIIIFRRKYFKDRE
jgi:hypothetical protein